MNRLFQIVILTGLLYTTGAYAQKTYYSYQSGDWGNPSTWTTDPSGTLLENEGLPAVTDTVVILNGRRIFTTASRTVAALHLSAGAVLDLGTTTGHNFGLFSGSGKLRIASASFPAGIPSSFVAEGGGTVEYYTAGNFQLPSTQQTYNHLILNLDSPSSIAWTMTNLTINGNLEIRKGTFRICDENMAPATDNRLIIDVKKDIIVQSEGRITVGNSPTNTANLPAGFGGSPPYTSGSDTMNSGYMPGALVTRYYDIYHKVYIGGNLINNGMVRFMGSQVTIPNFTTLTQYGAATVRFYGSNHARLVCNGPTDFYNLIVDKGVDQTYELTVYAANHTYFRLFGRNDLRGQKGGTTSGNGTPELRKALWIKNGTLRLTGHTTIASLSEGIDGTDTPNADFYVPTTAAFVIDGPDVLVLATADNYREVNVAWGFNESTNTFNVDNSGAISSFSIYGKFQINDGYMSCRKSGGFIFWSLASGEFIVNGGYLDAKQFRSAHTSTGIASFIMNGGTMVLRGRYDQVVSGVSSLADLRKVPIDYGSTSTGMLQGSRGTFNLASTANHFSMTKGNIYIHDICGTSSYLAIQILSDIKNVHVTGGSFRITTSNNDYHDIVSTAPLGNLSISRRTANATCRIQLPLTVLDSLNIENGYLDATTANNNLTVGGDFRLFTTSTYNPRSNTTTLSGNRGHRFENAGTIPSGLYNFTIQDKANVLITNNLTIRNQLSAEAGCILNDGGRTITVQGNMLFFGLHQSVLNGSILLSGSANQEIDAGGTGIFGNLTLNKNSGSVQWISDGTVNGILRLAGTFSVLDIGRKRLILGAQAKIYSSLTTTDTIFNSSKMIRTAGNMSDGGITRRLGSGGFWFYPIGTAAGYTPAGINISAPLTDSSEITVKPTNNRHPFASGTGNALKYYWKIQSRNIESAVPGTISLKLYYPDAAIEGNESLYIPAFYLSPDWKTIPDVFEVNDPLNEISFRNITVLSGDYTAGEPSAFGPVMVYYSRKNGNWDDPETWSTDTLLKWDGPPAAGIPGPSNQVIIGDGITHFDTVSITTDNRKSGSLQINSGSVLDMGTTKGHIFDVLPELKIGGSGTLRISSSSPVAIFPGSDFGNFLSASGGTVEYYSSGTSFTLPEVSASGFQLDHYNNLVLSAKTGDTIRFPGKNLEVINLLIVGRSSDFTGHAIFSSALQGDVTVGGNAEIRNGWLVFPNSTTRRIAISGNLVVGSNASFVVSGSGTPVPNELILSGNLINNGTFTMNAGGGRIVHVFCTGSGNANISGTGSTAFYTLTVDKGENASSVLDVQANGFSMTAADPALILRNGTFRLSAPVTVTLTQINSFTVPRTAGLSVNGGTIRIGYGNRDTADLILAGTIEILSGALLIGDSTQNVNNDIVYANAGFPEIRVQGGLLAVNGQIRRGTETTLGSLIYKQSGGTTLIRGLNQQITRGKLEIENSGSTFFISGGRIIIRRGGGTTYGDLYLRPDIATVNGGTIEFTPPANLNQNYLLDAGCPLYHLTINGSTSSTASVSLFVHPLSVQGNLTIASTGSELKANGLDVHIKGNFYHSGTYIPSGNHTIFEGESNQTMELNTPITFAHLHIAVNGTLQLAGAENPVVTDTLRLLQGTLNDNGRKLYARGHILMQSTHASSGSGRIVLQGNASQTISGNGQGAFGNLEISNSEGIILRSNLTINGTLTFTTGSIYIDDNLLTFGQAASIAGTPDAMRSVQTNGVLSDAGVRKLFPAGSSDFTFPVGVTNKYTPVRYQITSNGSAGSITVKPISGTIPSIQGASPEALAWYWNVSSTGFNNPVITHTYFYSQTDVNGNENNYTAGRYYQEQWVPEGGMPGTVNSSANTITLTNKTFIDGEYTAANPALLMNIPTYYSRTSGDWEDPATWSTVSHTGPAATVPPNGNPVKIAGGHTITAGSNYLKAYSVDILGILNLKATYGHSLGHVSGSGRIIMANTPYAAFVFPGGEFSAFMNTPQSTVEYQGAGILPVIKIYQNIEFTGAGAKEIPDVSVLVQGDLLIKSGTLDNTSFNQEITLLGNWTDQTTSGFLPGTGIVRFEGTAGQLATMAGTGQFYDVSVNNSAGIVLSGTSEIQNTLYLTKGIVTTTGSSLTLMNTSPDAVSGGSAVSYIHGPLRKNMLSNASFRFPVGKDGRYGEVTILNTNAASPSIWEAEYYNQNPHPTYDTSQVVLPLESVSGNEYWRIKGPDGGMANVRLRWDAQSNLIPPTAADRLKLRVAEWMPAWTSVGNRVTDFGPAAGYVETTTPVALNEHVFTLGIEKLPTARILSGNTEICNDGSEATVVIGLTGTPPWTFTYTINGGKETTVNNIASSPYNLLFNGASLGGPGTYTIRISSVSDATGSYGYRDFVTTATITVKQTPEITLSGKQNVAENETGVVYATPGTAGDTYLWVVTGGAITAGQGTKQITVSWGAAGSGKVELTETNPVTGCSDYSSLNITINSVPKPQITGPVSLCAGTSAQYTTPPAAGHTFRWKVSGGNILSGQGTNSINVSWSAAGTGNVSVRDSIPATGYFGDDSLGVVVNPVPLSTIAVSGDTICPGSVAGITIHASEAGIRYQLRNDATNEPVGTPVTGTGMDIILSDNPQVPTVYNILATNEYYCSVQLSAKPVAAFYPAPSPVLSVTPNPVCEGESITLQATDGDYFVFLRNNEIISEGTQSSYSTSDVSNNDAFKVIATSNTTGCTGTSNTIAVTVYPSPEKPVISPGGTVTIDEGESIVLSSSEGYQYEWTPGGETSRDITVSAEGSYTVRIISAEGCRSEWAEPVTVIVKPFLEKPAISITGALSFCEGDSTDLYGPEGYLYIWSTGETTRMITVKSSGTYSLRIADLLGHISPPSDPVTIEVHPRPAVTLAGKKDITCFGGNDGQISVDVTGGTAPYTYQWTGGLSGPAPTGCAAGTYHLILTDSWQCSDELTVELTQPPAIQAEATVTKPYCPDIADGNIALAVSGGTGPLSVSWNNSLQGLVIENLMPGTYQYTVTDSKGCTLNGSVTLTPEHDQCVIIPTIITPNNDGYNDTWIMPGIEMYPDASVEVFDRWGKRVFFSKGYATPWDGTFKGNALPMDSYHYVIRLRPEYEPIKGTITIVR